MLAKKVAAEKAVDEALVEEEYKKRVEAEIVKRVEEGLKSAEIQSEIKRRIAEGRAVMIQKVEQQLEEVSALPLMRPAT